MKIGNKNIGSGNPCFIVAEFSGNHHQKYEEAVALLKAAKAAGTLIATIEIISPDVALNFINLFFICIIFMIFYFEF